MKDENDQLVDRTIVGFMVGMCLAASLGLVVAYGGGFLAFAVTFTSALILSDLMRRLTIRFALRRH